MIKIIVLGDVKNGVKNKWLNDNEVYRQVCGLKRKF